MGIKGRKESKLIRIIKGPIRILARARDLYFQNLSSGGVHVFSSSGMSCPTPQLASLSRNTSVSSSNSRSSTSSHQYSRRSSPISRRALAAPVPRSHSVPIGRIDEDKCCDFDVNDEPVVAYPKSRSCATTGRSHIDDYKMDGKYLN